MAYKLIGLGTLDANLAHVADVKNTHILTHGIVLLSDVVILYRHVEAAERRHKGALLHMAVMETGFNQILVHLVVLLIVVLGVKSG